MKQELRSDRILGQEERFTERWMGRERVEAACRADEVVARGKQVSLRKHAQRLALELGLLVRRSAEEAPEVYERLRHAAEALQLLGARLALAEERQRLQPSRRENI